ncbi:MAG TPA: glycogen debranching enzyme, partial [Candidatus Krumholzibacteria bacterium]|nr:glycogen debranching enzyme [Candidatus Krumholzibacteria bacterium]
CFKGIDNAAYYRLVDGDHRRYLNITGTDNTVNAGHPHIRGMILDALRYWAGEMNVDGFRLDLAAVIGRHGAGLDFRGEFLDEIQHDPLLADRKLIAEPWDLARDGHQLGRFPAGWLEWNDHYRDDVREFWLRRAGNTSAFVLRTAGSPDVFDGRAPQSSVNYITCHDGFTLRDLVSYEHTHNEANGEDNRDGMRENHAWNCGVEGASDDSWIRTLRDRERRNLLTTLLLSQGVPMLLAGDETGRTQRGNNNAYCQDNEVSWLDWNRVDRALVDFVGLLCRLRTEHPALRRTVWLTGSNRGTPAGNGIRCFDALGSEITSHDTVHHALQILIPGGTSPEAASEWAGDADVLLLCNPRDFDTVFSIPTGDAAHAWWQVVDTGRTSHAADPPHRVSGVVTTRPHTLVVLMGAPAT